MRFTYDECTLINLLLEEPDKIKFLKKLDEIKGKTSEAQIRTSIDSLVDKVEGMSVDTVKKLYNDRLQYKVNVFPVYEI